jgi:DNA repair protein RecN (Recombination protein N)
MTDATPGPASIDELRVTNLGLIPFATVDPGPGLVAISGETGTGKTLLLGALRLLRGEQARKDQIGPSGDETVVEARFVDGDDERVLSRRVNRSRSRATIDGSMATAANLAETLDGVLDVVGQHDRTLLREPAAVRRLLDGSLTARGNEALATYRVAWSRLVEVEAEAAALGGDRRVLERELDMIGFQCDEIATAGFEPGEDEELAGRAARLRNAAELRERLAAAGNAAGDDGAVGMLDAAIRELNAASRADRSLGELADLGGQVAELLGELNAGISGVAADLDHDPGELEAVEDRLATLADLIRKYGDDLAAVLAFREKGEMRADELASLLERADEIGAVLDGARADVTDAAAELTRHRVETGSILAAGAVAHLADLGFTDPIVEFSIEPREPGPDGADRVVLLFASDAGLKAAPVNRIASGGELSRLILALRLAAGTDDASIIAFDEIDAGIGGATALAMGRKLKALSRGRQVFCVTHLPQVAAFADRHFVVRREGNVAVVSQVEGEERLEELSRMLAGVPDSAQGRGHAAELLEIAGAS